MLTRTKQPELVPPPAHVSRFRRREEDVRMKVERKLAKMGIELPDFGRATYYGTTYGKLLRDVAHGRSPLTPAWDS